MSRAFVREADGDEAAADLPDRAISPHPNYVTPSGLALIDAEIVRLRGGLAAAQTGADKAAIAALSRDLRYWTSRRSSAEVAPAPAGDDVRFGSTVTIEREDGRQQIFRITGEDEADPSRGTLSYVAPLARALIGKHVSDEIEFNGESVLLIGLDQERSS